MRLSSGVVLDVILNLISKILLDKRQGKVKREHETYMEEPEREKLYHPSCEKDNK